jgi:hypothetical protein
MENKEKVDAILQKCANLFANLGTGTALDVGSDQKAKQLEKEWLKEIQSMDAKLYEKLVPSEE